MIEELLKLSRAGLVIGEEKEVSLGDIARQAIELVTAQIKKHRIKVEISPDLPVVRGDPVRLREVFQNLVENAAKFMGDQPAPHIEIGVRNDTSEPVFYVRDNGMGIETEYHSRIFDIFEQLDQEFDGSGVGLALVKRIVEKHGGRIWAESEGAGKGASFCFTLPGVLPQVTKMNGSKREEICS
jgi:signal transduction histidine kinase